MHPATGTSGWTPFWAWERQSSVQLDLTCFFPLLQGLSQVPNVPIHALGVGLVTQSLGRLHRFVPVWRVAILNWIWIPAPSGDTQKNLKSQLERLKVTDAELSGALSSAKASHDVIFLRRTWEKKLILSILSYWRSSYPSLAVLVSQLGIPEWVHVLAASTDLARPTKSLPRSSSSTCRMLRASWWQLPLRQRLGLQVIFYHSFTVDCGRKMFWCCCGGFGNALGGLVLVDRTRRVSLRCWRMTARRPRLRWKFSPRSSLKVSKLLKVTAIELQSYSSAAKQWRTNKIRHWWHLITWIHLMPLSSNERSESI